MKQLVNFSDFVKSFEEMGRDNQFSYTGLGALFEYLEAYEEDTGDELELDVIGLCCDFTEYKNIAEFQANYGKEYKTIEDITNKTNIIFVGDDGFIIQNL